MYQIKGLVIKSGAQTEVANIGKKLMFIIDC